MYLLRLRARVYQDKDALPHYSFKLRIDKQVCRSPTPGFPVMTVKDIQVCINPHFDAVSLRHRFFWRRGFAL